MPDYGEKNCACGGKKRINSELENCMHVGEVVASEKQRESAYIFCKKWRLVGLSWPRIPTDELLMTDRCSE